jgi:hypothetical protein
MEQVVDALKKQGPDELALRVRGPDGGLLDHAVQAATARSSPRAMSR